MSTNTYRLPPRFYDDHVDRDLPAGVELSRTKTHVVVEMDDYVAEEILDDARYYSEPYGPDVDFGLKASARATAKAIIKARSAQRATS